MRFEVILKAVNDDGSDEIVYMRAENWYMALRETMQARGQTVSMQEMSFSLLEDGQSVQGTEERSGLAFQVLALETDTVAESREALTFLAEEEAQKKNKQFKRTPPAVKLHSFSLDGFYSPGVTEEVLTEAFMKLANLYDAFAHDQDGAIKYVLQLLFKSIKADGGGVLLTDLNDPSSRFSFALAAGSKADELKPLVMPPEQGILRHCRETSLGLNVPDAATHPSLQTNPLLTIEADLGPLLCAPIQHQHRLLGVLILYKRKPSIPFSNGEFDISSYLASSLGEYLHTLQSF